ncbi:MAG: PKD domain-containing protein, partial [Candidatus Angelobacter sp.]
AGGSVSASTTGSSDSDGSIVASSIDFGDGTVVLGSSASHHYTVAGTYTLRATVTDNHGASSATASSINVTPQHVTVTSPTFASTTSTSVHVVGTAFSGYRITATQVYLDGVLKYQIAAGTADTVLALARGTHRIAVKGWDSSGVSFLKALSVTRQ